MWGGGDCGQRRCMCWVQGGGLGRRRVGGVPRFGTELSNHVGSYAGCCAALANAAEKGGHGNANGGVDVNR